MAQRIITIKAGDVSATAELNGSETADKIWNALPIQGSANLWGDEIYFPIPVKTGRAADARDIVDKGDLAYWPPGSAFCIFFGLTPASTGNDIRPASAVNVFGRVQGDAGVFRRVASGAGMMIDKA